MKVSTALAAAAALSFPLTSHASSSSHGPDSAHARRFNRVLRSTGPDAAPAIDLELKDGQFTVRNASLVALGDATSEGDETHSLSKRGFSGRATFFSPGLGACGTYSSGSDFMVALSTAQYGDTGAVSSWCFQTITISYGGKTANAQVLDACPGCPYGGLDMSPALFQHFADESVGVFYMNWAAAGSGGGSSGGGSNSDQQSSSAAAAAASSSSAAAAWASSSSAAAAWASSSSSRAAAWASSSSSAQAAYLASSSAAAAAAAASSASVASVAAEAAAASRVSAASVASVASAAAQAAASDVALSIAAASAASVASVASAAAVSASVLPTATLSAAAAAVATATGVAKVASPSIPAGAVGGNLDGIAQLVIAMGNVVAAQAAVAESA